MSLNLSFNQAMTILGLVLPILVPFGQAMLAHLMERMPSARRAQMQEVISTVVHGVQQGMAGQDGATKKQEAVDAVVGIAKSLGIPAKYANPSFVSWGIEAAVLELNTLQHDTGSQFQVPTGTAGVAPSAAMPSL